MDIPKIPRKPQGYSDPVALAGMRAGFYPNMTLSAFQASVVRLAARVEELERKIGQQDLPNS